MPNNVLSQLDKALIKLYKLNKYLRKLPLTSISKYPLNPSAVSNSYNKCLHYLILNPAFLVYRQPCRRNAIL